jgi:hypothetical protein
MWNKVDFGTHSGCNAVLIPDLVAKHEADCLFVAKGYVEALPYEVQSSVTNEFEAYDTIIGMSIIRKTRAYRSGSRRR